MTNQSYIAETVNGKGSGISDIRIQINGKVWHMWGRNGDKRESQLADKITSEKLPVLMGSGLGVCLDRLAEKGPVAVVDRENNLSDISGTAKKKQHHNILWLDDDDPKEVIRKLFSWQHKNSDLSFEVLRIPVYIRLDKNYYGLIADSVEQGQKVDFWAKAKYPKFQNTSPRILFLNRPYFLGTEIKEALKRKEIEYISVDVGSGETVREGFVEDLLRAVIDYKPDFALTINHFGVDRQGKLTELLYKLDLPLASWFVDNPYLILYRYDGVLPDKTAIFTYDAGNLDIMRERGFKNVFYLPLATDPYRFKPGISGKPEWQAQVSFIGNSMVKPVAKYFHEACLPKSLSLGYKNVATEFGEAQDLSVSKFLRRSHPNLLAEMEKLAPDERKLSYEALITWEATRQYRLNCVKSLMDKNPLIVGDEGWKDLLAESEGWRYLDSLDYYKDLPGFYGMSEINFNCTSRQMKGAVNQRIFDVPACGGFILTDYREQMENLFEPETEVVSYKNVEEINELLEKYLREPVLRKKISVAARKRIVAEHTYDHRISELVDKMSQTFGGGF